MFEVVKDTLVQIKAYLAEHKPRNWKGVKIQDQTASDMKKTCNFIDTKAIRNVILSPNFADTLFY